MPNVITTSASNAQPSSVGTDVGVNATKVAVTVQSLQPAQMLVYGFDCDAAPQPLVVKSLESVSRRRRHRQTLVPLTPVRRAANSARTERTPQHRWPLAATASSQMQRDTARDSRRKHVGQYDGRWQTDPEIAGWSIRSR